METNQSMGLSENLYLTWGKNYIKITNELLEIKCKGSFIMNGIVGGRPNVDIICDTIENFCLLYFQIIMKFNVNFILLHKGTGTKYRIEIMVKKQDVNNFLKFRDIMDAHGVFENKTRMEIFYGKDSEFQSDIKKLQEKKVVKKDFYEELKHLPGFFSFFTRKEIEHLRKMLNPNENVLAVTSGLMNGTTWLIACTSKRVVLIDRGLVYGTKHSEILISKINSISFETKLINGDIHVEDGSSPKIIKDVPAFSAKPFVDAVHKAIEMQNISPTPRPANMSIADELLKFKQLLDMGAITDKEFEEQKQKLLNSQK